MMKHEHVDKVLKMLFKKTSYSSTSIFFSLGWTEANARCIFSYAGEWHLIASSSRESNDVKPVYIKLPCKSFEKFEKLQEDVKLKCMRKRFLKKILEESARGNDIFIIARDKRNDEMLLPRFSTLEQLLVECDLEEGL